MSEKRRPILLVAGVGLGLVVAAAACRKYNVISNIKRYLFDPLKHQKVHIILTPSECSRVVSLIQADVAKFNVLGFDCEWLTVDGIRRPVALLQLATHSGLCALFRLSHLNPSMPAELKRLLEDETILKVGVAPRDDAKYLLKDYDVQVRSTLDLRHLAQYLERAPEGLAKMSKAFVGVELNKNWRIRCSSWDCQVLTEAQVDYAAKDCLVAIEIYKKLLDIFRERTGGRNKAVAKKEFLELSHRFLDKAFSQNQKGPSGVPGASGRKLQRLSGSGSTAVNQRRNVATRTKPLYDNCFMEAPDGELLCTMDRTKAEWYCKRGLATLVCNDPLRMRLCFEPSGRAVGQPGQYDLSPKENRCVVCGLTDNFSRKFVIPKEYRRFFPIALKSHSSHDILLLCLDCHRISSLEDNRMRERLAILCKAPLICHLKKLKSYARALLADHLIPGAKVEMLQYIRGFHEIPEAEEIAEEFLKELTALDTKSKAGDNTGHAQKVTDYFIQPENGGLLVLEKMWREHFLETMKPKYLPAHWSVVHNANRLEIRGAIEDGLMSLPTTTADA